MLSRKRIIRLIVGTILILLGFIVIWIGFIEWWRSGSLPVSLPANQLPTAQFLFTNPEPTPNFISISPSVGKTISKNDEICVYADGDSSWAWTQIKINGVRISHSDITIRLIGRFDARDSLTLRSQANRLQGM